MYTVFMEKECGCFKRSEFTNNQTFETQQDAYKYANLAAEVMSEDFCGKHEFYAQRAEGDSFVIRMGANPNAGSSCSTPASDGWEKESASGGSCGTGCGCA